MTLVVYNKIQDLPLVFQNNARLQGLLLNYLEPAEFSTALIGLRDQIEAGKKQMSSLEDHDFLVGEWGLTGVCLGYALTCVNWVEKHAPFATLSPFMHGRPSEEIRHLQKLLVLAVYQSISKGTDPEKIWRTPENRNVINGIFENYAPLPK